jgi:effector-binding domain-containing protein
MIEVLSNGEKSETKLTESEKEKRLYDASNKLNVATSTLKKRTRVITEPIISVNKKIHDDLPGFRAFGVKYAELKEEIDELCEKLGINEPIPFLQIGKQSLQTEKLSEDEINIKFRTARNALVDAIDKIKTIRSILTTDGMSIKISNQNSIRYEIMVLEVKKLRAVIYALGRTFGLNIRPVKVDDISLKGRQHTRKYS